MRTGIRPRPLRCTIWRREAFIKYGIVMFPTDLSIRPDRLAVEVETRDFESLWFPEHSHIPITEFGGKIKPPALPEYYQRILDPFVALSAAAMVTTRLRLGTGVTLVAQRDPIWLAKEVASLDYLSGGRVLFGIGYGWNRLELENHGVQFGERRSVLADRIAAMKALWGEDEASYSGDHVAFGPSWAWPKPVQQPHPPILMGASAGPKTFADIVDFCDGWMPLRNKDLPGEIAQLRELAAERGRDSATIEISQFWAKAQHDQLDLAEGYGVSRSIFAVPPAPEAEVIEVLDRLHRLISER